MRQTGLKKGADENQMKCFLHSQMPSKLTQGEGVGGDLLFSFAWVADQVHFVIIG